MERKSKRALLARLEGQLAAMAGSASALRWLRVKRAFDRLRVLPRDAVEQRYLDRLQRCLARLALEQAGQAPGRILVHRYTLARVECISWQVYLRGRRVRIRQRWRNEMHPR